MSFEMQQRKFVSPSVRVWPEGLTAVFTAAVSLARRRVRRRLRLPRDMDFISCVHSPRVNARERV